MMKMEGVRMKILPYADTVIIPIEKFTQYALSADEDKAVAFHRALGYTVKNAETLIGEIKKNLSEFYADELPDLGYGKRYQVIMALKGVNGKTANVLTGWINDSSTHEMRLTTAFVTNKSQNERMYRQNEKNQLVSKNQAARRARWTGHGCAWRRCGLSCGHI
jgi:hypothetical protein